MLRRILALSLVVLPLYEVVLYFSMPGRSMPAFQDMRITKDFVCMALSLAIGLFVLYRHGFKPMKDKFLLAFIIFLTWNIFKIPTVNVIVGSTNINGMWNYIPAFQIMALFILFLGITNSPELKRKRTYEAIAKAMAISGVLMGAYMIIQSLGLDQIFKTFPAYVRDNGVDYAINGSTKNPSIGGTLGHPTLSAPFLVMTFPFIVYSMKWYFSVVVLLAVLLSGSSVAILALALMLFTYLIYKVNVNLRAGLVMAILLFSVAGLLALYKFTPWVFNDNGRFAVWNSTYLELFQGIGFTGAGIGAYKFLFAVQNGSGWYQAHNDWLQLLWCCGLIGLFLVGMFVRNIFISVLKSSDEFVKFLGMSFLGVCLCGLGTFVFQLAVFQFYVVVIVGMIFVLTREVDYAKQ